MTNLKPFIRTMTVLYACMMVGCASLPPSSAISYHVGFNLLNSTNTVIADLASKNSDSLDHQITTKSTGRILVSAQVHIQNPGGIAVRWASSCEPALIPLLRSFERES